ncbi:unnamed protein product, partial [Polarella glacialis]
MERRLDGAERQCGRASAQAAALAARLCAAAESQALAAALASWNWEAQLQKAARHVAMEREAAIAEATSRHQRQQEEQLEVQRKKQDLQQLQLKDQLQSQAQHREHRLQQRQAHFACVERLLSYRSDGSLAAVFQAWKVLSTSSRRHSAPDQTPADRFLASRQSSLRVCDRVKAIFCIWAQSSCEVRRASSVRVLQRRALQSAVGAALTARLELRVLTALLAWRCELRAAQRRAWQAEVSALSGQLLGQELPIAWVLCAWRCQAAE